MTDAPRSLLAWVGQVPRYRLSTIAGLTRLKSESDGDLVRWVDLVQACSLPREEELNLREQLQAERLVAHEHFNYYLRECERATRLRAALERIAHGMDLRFAETKGMAEVAREALLLDAPVAALDGSAREESLASMQASLLDTLKGEDDNV